MKYMCMCMYTHTYVTSLLLCLHRTLVHYICLMSIPLNGAHGEKCLPVIGVEQKLSYNIKATIYICINFLFMSIIGKFNHLKVIIHSPIIIVN